MIYFFQIFVLKNVSECDDCSPRKKVNGDGPIEYTWASALQRYCGLEYQTELQVISGTWDLIQHPARRQSLIFTPSLQPWGSVPSSIQHPAQVLSELWIDKFYFHLVSKYIYCIQWPKNYITSGEASFPSFQPSGTTVSVSLLCQSGIWRWNWFYVLLGTNFEGSGW